MREKKTARLPKNTPSDGAAASATIAIGTLDQDIDQGTTGSLTGTVVDSTADAVVGQQITLLNYTRRTGPSGTEFVALQFVTENLDVWLIVDLACAEVSSGTPTGTAGV